MMQVGVDRMVFVMWTARAATPRSGVLRGFRSAAFAGCAVWLSLGTHVVGGGTAPSVVVLATLVLLMTALGSLVAGRQRGPLGIAALLLAMQAALHHAFAFFSIASTCRMAMPVGDYSMNSPAHAEMIKFSNCAAPEAMNSPDAVTAGLSPGMLSPAMLTWHVAAALVLGALLSHGERAVWSLLSRFLPRPPSRVVVPSIPAAAELVVRSSIRPRRGLLSGGVGRRGPPFECAAPA
jgi:hypothetical protein